MKELRTGKLTDKEKEEAKKVIAIMEGDGVSAGTFKDETGKTLYLIKPGTTAEIKRKDLENDSKGKPKTPHVTDLNPPAKGIPVFIDKVDGYLVANQ